MSESIWDAIPMPIITFYQHIHISRWPSWASRWVGYREEPWKKPEHELVVYFWAFIGSFCTIAVLQAIFGYEEYFEIRNVPSIVASFGASALLCFEAIKVPFAQPRALIGGHIVSAFVGIAVTRLIGDGREVLTQESLWFACALSTGLAIVCMKVTKTTHPPAGATALLVAADPGVYGLGWYYLPIVILSSVVVLVLACFFNNIQRQYPTYWFIIPEQACPGCPPPLPMPVTSAARAKEEDPRLRSFILKLKDNRSPDLRSTPQYHSSSSSTTAIVEDHEMANLEHDLERGYFQQPNHHRHLSL